MLSEAPATGKILEAVSQHGDVINADGKCDLGFAISMLWPVEDAAAGIEGRPAIQATATPSCLSCQQNR